APASRLAVLLSLLRRPLLATLFPYTTLFRSPFLPQVLARPGWLLGFWRDGLPMSFPNILLPEGPMPYADIGAQLAAAAVSWRDLEWIREAWGGPIVVKGVHTSDDARKAVDAGADAVVVSNHGGRQLDGVAATLHVLPEVLEEVGDEVEVLLDGGVRRGADVAKAVALGAKAVLVGRAYAYGLGAAGREGVAKVLELLGCPSVAALDESYLGEPRGWPPAAGVARETAGVHGFSS